MASDKPNAGEIEQRIDNAVMARLRTDASYKYAECADDQANREDEIGQEEAARILRSYGINLDEWLDASTTLEVD